MASRTGIEALLDLLEEAFRGRGIEASNESQALLTNIATVPPDQWQALPAGAARSIQDIAEHVGACKVMYDDYAFGSGTLRFGTPEVEPFAAVASPAEIVAWLTEVHARLVSHVAALSDDTELDVSRLTNWAEQRPTRWIIAAMITHDAYHAGEINHLRSLLEGDDSWRFQAELGCSARPIGSWSASRTKPDLPSAGWSACRTNQPPSPRLQADSDLPSARWSASRTNSRSPDGSTAG
jgi:uncharacterized damage-inducible protein DinB